MRCSGDAESFESRLRGRLGSGARCNHDSGSHGSRSWRTDDASAGWTSECREAPSRCGVRRGQACRTACREPLCSRCTHESRESGLPRGITPRSHSSGDLAIRPTSSRSATSGCSRSGGSLTTPRAASAPSRRPNGYVSNSPVGASQTARLRVRWGCTRTRSDTPRQPGRSPSAGTAHERRSSGPSARRSSIRTTPAASSLDAISTSSGRAPLTRSPAGQGSPGARRPMHSRRSKDRCSRSDRRSATRTCSQPTNRPCAPARPPPRPRGCCRAVMRTTCSRGRNGSSSSPERISGRGSGRPACGRVRSSSKATSVAPGGVRSTRCRSTRGRAFRVACDAVEAEATALPLPNLAREIEVVFLP